MAVTTIFSPKPFNDLTENIIHFHQCLAYEEFLCKLEGKNLKVNSNVCFEVVGVCASAKRK